MAGKIGQDLGWLLITGLRAFGLPHKIPDLKTLG